MKTSITSNDNSNPGESSSTSSTFGASRHSIAIVNGKRYRCDTATHIAEYHCGLTKAAPHYMVEALFQTRKGAFFLSGKGGPMTKYWNLDANTKDCDHLIQPLSPAEAQAWLESHGFVDILERLFADELEDA